MMFWSRGLNRMIDVPQVSQGVIDGVQLGPLLGKGSFGRVYQGIWQGQQVAVKVRLCD